MNLRTTIFLLFSLVYFFSYGEEKYNIDGVVFSILSQTEHLCAIEPNETAPYEGEFIIPSYVNIEGTMYRVSQINSAFFGCGDLISLTIPATISRIEYYSFYGCGSLENVIIEDGSTNLIFDEYATFGNSLKQIYIGRNLSYYNMNSTHPDPSTPKSPLKFNEGLEKVEFGNLVSNIPASLFYNCTSLKSIEWGNGLKTISRCAFQQTGLEILILPEGLQSIGTDAFYYNENLYDVTLPSSLTKLYTGVFCACPKLSYVKCYALDPPYEGNAFCGSEIIILKVPKASIEKYKQSSGWRNFGDIQPLEENNSPYPSLYTISYSTVNGGVIKESIKEGETRNVEIIPQEGMSIHSVTINGREAIIDPSICKLTLFGNEDQVINIVYQSESGNPNGVPSPTVHKVFIKGDEICIEGEFNNVAVYDLDGQQLYIGTDHNIRIPHRGIFIIKVDDNTYKFHT